MYARFNKFGQNKINNNKYNYSSKINERSLEKDEEYKLITSWQKNKDRKSLDRLLGAYKKLVVSYSKKFFSYGFRR